MLWMAWEAREREEERECCQWGDRDLAEGSSERSLLRDGTHRGREVEAILHQKVRSL